MKYFIPKYFTKQVSILLTIFLATISFVGLSFTSCSNLPGTGTSSQSSTNEDSGDDEDDEDYEGNDYDDPEDCEESEGDPCKDDYYCSATCEIIYELQASVRSCKARGDKTVDFLEAVHNRLMGTKAGYSSFEDRSLNDLEKDLKSITDDKEDIGHEELKCYLQIGSKKYIKYLKKGLEPDPDETPTSVNEREDATDRLTETLKWIAEDDEVTEILKELSRGPDILQAILETLSDYYTETGSTRSDEIGKYRCIATTEYKDNRPSQDPGAGAQQDAIFNKKGNPDLDQALWWIGVNNNLRVWYYDGTNGSEANNTIKLSDDDLFNAVSCFHKIDNDDHNILSYSAKEDNQDLFSMAMELLKYSCEDADTKKEGCTRALMCWSSWQKSCFEKGDANAQGYNCHQAPRHTEDRNNTKHLWNMADNYKEDLEQDGSSDYDNCTAKGFYDFFK